jgi:hypothetical protein
LMEVSIIIGSDARPIDRGSYAGSILHGSSGMTQALGVPEWGAWVTLNATQAPCVY